MVLGWIAAVRAASIRATHFSLVQRFQGCYAHRCGAPRKYQYFRLFGAFGAMIPMVSWKRVRLVQWFIWFRDSWFSTWRFCCALRPCSLFFVTLKRTFSLARVHSTKKSLRAVDTFDDFFRTSRLIFVLWFSNRARKRQSATVKIRLFLFYFIIYLLLFFFRLSLKIDFFET